MENKPKIIELNLKKCDELFKSFSSEKTCIIVYPQSSLDYYFKIEKKKLKGLLLDFIIREDYFLIKSVHKNKLFTRCCCSAIQDIKRVLLCTRSGSISLYILCNSAGLRLQTYSIAVAMAVVSWPLPMPDCRASMGFPS